MSGDDLILEHRDLVSPIVRRLRRRLPEQVETEELLAIGVLGLVIAARTYQANRGPFSYWARRKIRETILDALRDPGGSHARGPRPFRREFSHVPIDRDHPSPVQSVPAPDPDLEAARAVLPSEEQRLVELVYDENHSLREVGKRRLVGVGWRRANRLHDSALTRLRTTLEARGMRKAA